MGDLDGRPHVNFDTHKQAAVQSPPVWLPTLWDTASIHSLHVRPHSHQLNPSEDIWHLCALCLTLLGFNDPVTKSLRSNTAPPKLLPFTLWHLTLLHGVSNSHVKLNCTQQCSGYFMISPLCLPLLPQREKKYTLRTSCRIPWL